jgi:dipeptidyl aminopeptidase/acylaminoacyl peptidase
MSLNKKLIIAFFAVLVVSGQAQKRPMTFMDVIEMKQVTTADLSPDGAAVVFAVNSVDWKSGRAYSDIYLAATDGTGMKQLTFTSDKNEASPRWSPDGRYFAFLSDRESPSDAKNQLYIMRPDGGEAERLTSDKEGVDRFEFSPDGKWIAYSAGKAGERQLYLIKTDSHLITPLTKHETGVEEWAWGPDSKRIYFVSPDWVDKSEKLRNEKKFDVRIVDPPKPAKQLWVVEIDGKKEAKLTNDESLRILSLIVSKNGQKLAFRAVPSSRYATEEQAEVYLFDVASGTTTRVTNNNVNEERIEFSPDSRSLAFTAPEGFTYMRNLQIYVVPVSGGVPTGLVKDFDNDARSFFWSPDSQEIYFESGVGVNHQLFMVEASGGKPKQLTNLNGVVVPMVKESEARQMVLLSYTDPESPPDLYVARLGQLSSHWKRITQLNPQVKQLELGKYETVRWKSTDGVMVEGILVKPVGYKEGQRYPLIVQLHGGPASAYVNSFSGNYNTYVHVFAGNGYAVFQPNYRGSSNYGEKFRMQIAGDYFRQGYEDIISGVDYLIQRGIADPDKLGIMGWSAGGHWCNWALTHTDRFKAISSGAGAVNWVSMYAQTDVQAPREFYFRGKPYDNFEHYLEVSPIRYIKNAKTPTLIHVGEADRRVPMPQSLELHMALKKLGVPTELIVYPGMPHALTNPRYQLVKMVAEFGWFEKWIKGKAGWLDWKQLLDTLKDEKTP